MINYKKIAVLIIPSLKGGGAEQSVLTLAKGFYEIGYETHIITFKDNVEYELLPEISYHYFKTKKFNIFPKSIRYGVMSKFLDKFIASRIGNPNILLSNLDIPDKVMSHSKFDSVAFIIRNNIAEKYQVSIDNPNRSDKNFQWMNATYSKKPLVALSHGLEQDMRKLLDYPPVTTTINNPFDKKRILQMAEQALPNNITHDTKQVIMDGEYLIHVGFFKPQKAHDVLLKSYAKSSKKYPLLLLGKGELFEQMQQLAKDLGIENKVHFLGFHSNPYPFIKHAKAMVLSSHYEGFVRVVVESLVIGTPVISTDCPFGPDEVLPKQNLVPVNDVDAMAKKMTEPQTFFVPFDERLTQRI